MVWVTPNMGQPWVTAKGSCCAWHSAVSLMEPPADFIEIPILLLWIRFPSGQPVEPNHPMGVLEETTGADCLRMRFSIGNPQLQQTT